MKKFFTFFLLLLLFPLLSYCQDSETTLSNYFDNIPKAELLLLGTFHFADQGLDDYKPQYTLDISSEKKQQELKELLTVLARYAPTKIAVEVKANRQHELDSLYRAYLQGNLDLGANELYQIGFRLAKLLNHDKIYAIDAEARRFIDTLSSEENQKKQQYYMEKAAGKLIEREIMLEKEFQSFYAYKDQLKTKMSLLEYFRILNDPSVFRPLHGHYLVGTFKMGGPEDYYGPDRAIWWYNRNLRIFHNILRMSAPEDKIMVLIGAGHLPLLDFLSGASPDFDLVSFQELLED